MDLNHEFNVERPIDEAWAILTDVELIAPCLPGAQLQEVEGDVYRGVVKVKVGPIQAQFKGQASFLERDDDRHRAVLKGEGRDTTGKGNATALITAQLEEVGNGVTSCTVHTDLSITGKVAQFGRGALADVSDKLMTQFSDNLNELLSEQSGNGAPPVETRAESPPDTASESGVHPTKAQAVAEATATKAAPAATVPAASNGSHAGESTTNGVRKIDSPENEPIDLLETAGAPMLKRLLPVVGLLALVLLLLRRKRR
jgi:carbon monoxide dehydrogenase subunit G